MPQGSQVQTSASPAKDFQLEAHETIEIHCQAEQIIVTSRILKVFSYVQFSRANRKWSEVQSSAFFNSEEQAGF